MLTCKFRRLPSTDIQREQLIIGHVLDEAGAVGGALHRGIMENHQLAVFGDVNIAFKTVGSGLFHCHPEGQGAVLRVIAGKTAVCKQKRSLHIIVSLPLTIKAHDGLAIRLSSNLGTIL